jgi:pimeloyl-ACP methyl ester carboxylesterase
MLNGEDVGWPAELMVKAWLAGKSGIGLTLDSLDPNDIVQTLSMEYTQDSETWAPTKTTLKPDSQITPGPTLKLAYNQFDDFNFFEYDWRADVRESGRLLLEYLKQNKPESGAWKIIGHSLGGLVTVTASKLCAKENGGDDTAFSQLASHAVLLGSPLCGTMVAADALINGDNLSAPFSEHFKAIVRTWPSIHQLLPAWLGSIKKTVGGALTDDDYCLQDDAPWSSSNIDLVMLKRARDSRKDFFRAPLSCMNSMKTSIMMSRAWATNNHVVRDINNVLTVSNQGEPGDTSVPEETTRQTAGSVELSRMVSFGNDKDTMQHALLGCDPLIASAVRDFFQ